VQYDCSEGETLQLPLRDVSWRKYVTVRKRHSVSSLRSVTYIVLLLHQDFSSMSEKQSHRNPALRKLKRTEFLLNL
jgi:hypothetical protein